MAGFEEYRRDWQAIDCDRTLEIFRRSPVLRQIQTIEVNETQELHDALIDSLDARVIENAQGKNLDVIGRIVGVWPRPLVDAGLVTYFAPDNPLTPADGAPVYVTNAPISGQVEVGDVEYRRMIYAKIVKNATKYGSAPELQYWAKFAYNATISVKNIGNSDVKVVIASNTPASVVTEILGQRTDETADFQYNLPLPTTARIKEVFFKPFNAFAPDNPLTPVDGALVGVGYEFN